MMRQRFIEVDATSMALDVTSYFHLIGSDLLDFLAKTYIIYINNLSRILS